MIDDLLYRHPKKLFLVDGFGALLSAVLLGIVLTTFQQYFGIPRQVLYILSLLALLLALYDFFSYYFAFKTSLYLYVIATLNILYACISLGFTIAHQQTITVFGWLYIILEVTIILVLAILELKTARRLKD